MFLCRSPPSITQMITKGLRLPVRHQFVECYVIYGQLSPFVVEVNVLLNGNDCIEQILVSTWSSSLSPGRKT